MGETMETVTRKTTLVEIKVHDVYLEDKYREGYKSSKSLKHK